jgi:hypothetical protein
VAFKLADLFVQISGDSKPLNSALMLVHQQLLGMSGIGGQIGSSLISGLSGKLLGLSEEAAVAFGVAAIGATVAAVALGKAAFMAGHLNEAVNKSAQVFGSANPKIVALADELAAKFGIVKTTVLDTAASFGLMLQGAGFDRLKATEMSATLVRLAADAKSFFDVPLEEAIMRISSGLAGETESVRRWGINLTEANVKQKAMALGLFNGRGEMDQATKTAVRYQLILDGLKPATGDLERTGGGLIQQWEKLTGQVTNLATEIGGAVLPVVTVLVQAANVLVTAFGGMVRFAISLHQILVDVWGYVAKITGVAGLLGYGPDDSDKKAAAIDARIAKTKEEFDRDTAAGKASAKTPKGWSGGLEAFAKKVQDSAFGAKDWGKKTVDELKKIGDDIKKIARDSDAEATAPKAEPCPWF